MSNELSFIEIRIDTGQDIFEELPKADTTGNWIGKLKNIESGEAKYSIIYSFVGDQTIYILDPLMKVVSGTES